MIANRLPRASTPTNSYRPCGQSSITPPLRALSARFGSGRVIEDLIILVKNADGDANARLNAFKSLTRTTKPELLAVIRTLINDKVLGIAARSALAAYDDLSIPKQLTGSWPERSQEQQAATVATLTSRASYAKVLLEAVKAGKVPAAAISPFQARQIRNLGDEALTKLLTEAWGEIRDTPEAKKAEFAKWEAILKPAALAKADKSKGRLMFTAAAGAGLMATGQVLAAPAQAGAGAQLRGVTDKIVAETLMT